MRTVWVMVLAGLLSGCLGMPKQVRPVEGFDLQRYLGTWYEIARLDHSFERGLERVSATYSLRPDGGVAVLNKGYDPAKQAWKEANGKAYFVEDPSLAYLKVSFFGPFYGSYIVFGLDQAHYQYAFVSGPDHQYLWLLARTPSVSPAVLEAFRQRADAAGFDTSRLIYVNQESVQLD